MLIKSVLFQITENAPWHAGVQISLTGKNSGAIRLMHSIITETGLVVGPFHCIKDTEPSSQMCDFTDLLVDTENIANSRNHGIK
jgi:hypothetical protein